MSTLIERFDAYVRRNTEEHKFNPFDSALRNVEEIMRNTPTNEICSCLWRIHDEDQHKSVGTRRRLRVDENPNCPVHTKRGFMLFFMWVLQGLPE